jgi:IPT/TIG domain
MVAGGCGTIGSSGCNGNFAALSSTEFFNAQYGYWSFGPSMTQPRVFAQAALLPDGDVLMTGGDPAYAQPATARAELYTPVLLSVNPTSGPAGSQVTVSGSAFYAGEGVTLVWDGGTVLGKVKADSSGAFSATIAIPATATAGVHDISARGSRSFASADTTFTVTE